MPPQCPSTPGQVKCVDVLVDTSDMGDNATATSLLGLALGGPSPLRGGPMVPDVDGPAEPEAYQPDSKGLGRLRRVTDPAQWRKVWDREDHDFTPWLAQYIDDLGEALGMVLTVVGTEVPVGEFRLDIQARDDNNNVVVIENQLERTDHGHLGQCLVYASVLEASTVVWVARQFREDFRRALDWLNERTDEKARFFGVEVGLVRVDNSRLAPEFKLIVRPNDWAKPGNTVP